MLAVIHWAGRTGEVKYEVNSAHVKRFADIVFDELKAGLIAQMREVRAASGEQVVDCNHTPALTKQGIAKMRSQKTGATGDQSTLLAHDG
jgi:hypothetical protein